MPAGPVVSVGEDGDFSDLIPGVRADFFGEFSESDGCFIADSVIRMPLPSRPVWVAWGALISVVIGACRPDQPTV